MPRKPKTPFINRILSKRDKLQAGVVEDLLLEVAEERDLLEVIFDSMVEGVIATDRQGKVIFFNSAAQALFSFHEETVLGQDIRQLLPEGELRERIAAAVDTGERVYEAELRVDAPVERVLRINVIPLIDRLERFFGTVILVIDITERRVSEARLEQAEKLAAQTTLSAGIAHEIRNPLNSLSIHLQLVEKQLAELFRAWEDLKCRHAGVEEPPNRRKIEKNLRVIRDEVDRLDTVVKNFLLAVRPQKPNWSFVALEPLIASTLNLLEPELGERGVRIVFEPPAEQQVVPVDEFQFRQALVNLLHNSIDAMPGGGEIHIRLSHLPDRVRIQLLDTGEGIPKELQKRIFEPYFTTRPEGSGLGLSVVERVVREHRGRLRLYSEPGQGTCVTIDLPLSAEHSKQIPILEEEEETAAVDTE